MLTPTKSTLLRPRIALGVVVIAASIALTGCATVSSPPSSAAHKSPAAHTPAATPSAPAAYYYKDAAAKYAITFPGKPSVAAIEGSDTGAKRASYSTEPDPTAPKAVYYTSGGTAASDGEITSTNLESVLFELINEGAKLTSPEKKFTLDGMPAIMSDFTGSDGKPSAIVLAGKGHSYYQLIVRGGTSKERETFFDSFKLIG